MVTAIIIIASPTSSTIPLSPSHPPSQKKTPNKTPPPARRDVSKSTGHNRPDLVWDNKLEKDATAYAQHLCRANKGLQHSTGDQRPGQGENLAWSKPQGSVEGGSQMWVNEKKNYHGEKIGEGNFGAYGHFTQVCFFFFIFPPPPPRWDIFVFGPGFLGREMLMYEK